MKYSKQKSIVAAMYPPIMTLLKNSLISEVV